MLSSLKSTKFQVFVQCLSPDGKEVFRKIGDVGLNDDEQGFCLKADESHEETDDTLKTYLIFPSAQSAIRSIRVIKIVILGTRMGRAPVLKKLELWGLPASKTTTEEHQEIQRLLRGSESPMLKPLKEQEENSERANSEQVFNIPEEFIDSITQDVLVMPYILPSGNIIDESTLAKHNKHEEMYGRLPSDPYTGLPYSSNNQPKFNESLKTRLDQFKLQNSHEIEIKQSGRTVGKKSEPGTSRSSYSTNGHVSKKIKLSKTSSRDLDALISSIYQKNQVSIFTKPKETATKNDQLSCAKCESVTSTDVYRISPCNHLFCKPCLGVLLLNAICGACQLTFQTSNVTKMNL